MAEPIQIQVEFTGAQEAAREVDTVNRSIGNLTERMDAAARVAQELQAQQAAVATAARELAAREAAVARAAQEAEARQAAAARAAQELADRQARATRSTQELASRQTAAATSAIAFGQRLAAAANAIQGVTSALGVEGQTAGLIGRVTQTSAAMAQLGATFGPQGALVGGIVGAAIPAIQYMSQQLNEQEQRIVDLRAAADGLVTSYDDILARMNRVNSERARESRLGMGLGSDTEQRAFLESAENRAEQTRLQSQAAFLALQEASASEYAEAAANLRTAEEAERTARQTLERAQEGARIAASEARDQVNELMQELLSAGSEAETAAPARRGGGGRRRAETPQAAAVDEGDAMAVVRDILREQNDALREQEELMRGINELKDEAQEKDERLAARADALAEREKDRLEEHQQKLNEAADQARQRHEEQTEVYKSVMGVVVGGLNDALQSIISGQKTAGEAFEGLLASFLKYISEQSMLKAIFEYAEAIASFASYRVDQGAQHLAAGVAYTAVAVAAGAGSVALSAPSGATPSDQKPASPEAGAAGEGGRGGDVVINWNSPVVTAGTRAELGRDMASMIRAGSQRFGTV